MFISKHFTSVSIEILSAIVLVVLLKNAAR